MDQDIKSEQNTHFDLIIIGGSAAGASAAIYAARRQINVKLISNEWGGEVANSGIIGNYPGFDEINGFELAQKLKSQVEKNGVIPELGVTIESVHPFENVFKISGKKDNNIVSYLSKAVLITTGVHPRLLNIPGEKELKGKGVSYCSTCDGPLYRGKTVAVIGGGNSALESAIMLKDLCTKVYMLTINQELQGETIYITQLQKADNVEVLYSADTKKFIGQNKLESVEYLDNNLKKIQTIQVDGAFIHIGWIPNSSLAGGVQKNNLGEIMVDKVGQTSVPGIFAAGDVTDTPYKQIAIASGQGVSAVLKAIEYINKN